MSLNQEHLFSLIKDIKTKQWFDGEINKRFKHYAELFDKDTIALMIVDELGRNTQALQTISQMEPNGEYTIQGTIQQIHDVRSFAKKNGYQGKVVNIDITDDTGNCRLVLWNKDVGMLQQHNLQIGTMVKVINGYTKQGYTGELELHLGKWGMLDILSEPNDTVVEETAEDTISGILSHKEPTKAFFRDNGEFGFVTNIVVQTPSEQRKVTLWDKHVKDVQQYKIGEPITISGLIKKQKNGITEWQVNGTSKIKKK